MINIKEYNTKSKAKHIVIKSDEPLRIEIQGDDFILFGYKGIKDDIEQEPYICFDTELK